MVATGGLFLFCLAASRYNCRHHHGHIGVTRQYRTALFGVKRPSSSEPRRRHNEETRSPLSSPLEAEIGAVDEDSLQLLDGPSRQRQDEYSLQLLDERSRQRKSWEDRFSLLLQYRKREGDCNVPQSHIEGGEKLGLWVAQTRHFKKKGQLSQNKIDRLDEIHFLWIVSEAYWEKMFTLLKQYKAREGDCSVLQRHFEDGETLGAWVNNKRQLKRKGKLDPEKQKILEFMDFKWEAPRGAPRQHP
jgi:hypothetical protein